MTASTAFLASAGILLFTAVAAHLLSKAEKRGSFSLGFYQGTTVGCLVGVFAMLLLSALTGVK
jgi:hypothetical protein